jgi:hypothetical protein
MAPLGVQDFIRVGTGSGAGPGGGTATPAPPAYPITYGSEFLERVLRHACAAVPVTTCQVDFRYLKSQGFDKLVQESLQLKGAVFRAEQQARIVSAYLVLTCRYRAQSDEQKEGLFELGIHLETGAFVPAIGAGLETAMRSFNTGLFEPNRIKDQVRAILPVLRSAARERVQHEIALFQESMNRKFRRDVANLEEYYQSLEKEMRQSLDRSGLSEQLVRERLAKIALIPEELARKKEDLYKKYSIRISTAPCAALLVTTPGVKVLLNVAIGRKERLLSAFYNPITKTMDPLVCEGCRSSATALSFCGRAHLLCRNCSGDCPICRNSG